MSADADGGEPNPSTDELLARIEELEQEQEQLNEQQQQIGSLSEQFKQGRISRRAFLGAVTAAAGVGVFAGNASAHSANPSWGNSQGQVGTESQPVNRSYVRDLHSESIETNHINTDLYVEPGDGDPFAVINDYLDSNSQSAYKFVLGPGDYTSSTTLDVTDGSHGGNIGQNTPVFIEGYSGQESSGVGTYIDCSGLGASSSAMLLSDGDNTRARIYLRDFALADSDMDSFAIENAGGLNNTVIRNVAFDGFDTQIKSRAMWIRSEFKDIFSRDGQFIHATDETATSEGWNVIRMEDILFANNSDPAMLWDGIGIKTAWMDGDAQQCDGTLFRVTGGDIHRGIRKFDWHLENMDATGTTPIFEFDNSDVRNVDMSITETNSAGGVLVSVPSGGRVFHLTLSHSAINDLDNILSVSGQIDTWVVKNSNIGVNMDMSNVLSIEFENIGNIGSETVTWPNEASMRKDFRGGWGWSTFEPRSSTPPNNYDGQVYLDDGTNRSDSSYGFRVYNGSSWVDI